MAAGASLRHPDASLGALFSDSTLGGNACSLVRARRRGVACVMGQARGVGRYGVES